MSDSSEAVTLDALYRQARSHNAWTSTPIGEADIAAIYELAKWGPTTANSNPTRFTWVVSEAAKARLAPHLSEGNRPKGAAASAVAIVAYDLDFPEHMPRLFPHAPEARNWFEDQQQREVVALRNSSLQGAYLLLAARALGWDTGPMSGFDNVGLDADFFAGTRIKSNFLIAVGKGSGEKMFGRLPRLSFQEANTLL